MDQEKIYSDAIKWIAEADDLLSKAGTNFREIDSKDNIIDAIKHLDLAQSEILKVKKLTTYNTSRVSKIAQMLIES